jgi:transposase
MAYYFRKKLKGQYYLFRGESAYERGTSVRKKSKYIAPYDELCEYFQQADVVVEHQQHFEYGLSRAVHELAKQLGLVHIFKHQIKKKGKDQYLAKRILIMAINRLVWPCAKYSIEKWFSKSDLCNVLDLPASELASHKIYRAMDKLDEFAAKVEEAVCKVIAVQENISFETLYLDFTNQETHSRNHDSDLLDYGHNKHGRDDLYQVNISLCCDATSGIPFFHKSYPGNFNDKQFIKIYAEELRKRLEGVGWRGKTLLIIDRGINGANNFALLRDYQFDYIGGLIEKEFPSYFGLPKSSMRKRYKHKRETKPPLQIHYTTKTDTIYGQKHLVLIFYNQENYEEKIQRLNNDLNRYQTLCERKLEEFKQDIAGKTFESKINNVEKIKKSVEKINKKLYPLLDFEVKSYRFELTWKIKRNQEAYNKHIGKFGIHVLFTNRLNLTPLQVLKLFFAKDKIEKNFQFLKANAYTNQRIVLGPMLHSKDERIESHVYTCIIALQLYQILRHRLKQKKFPLTTQQALEELEDITCYYTKIMGKKEVIRHINTPTDTQRKILKALQINVFE